MKFQKGDRVRCKHAVEAYYSNYGGNGLIEFTPVMTGVVANIAPKVTILRVDPGDPTHDGKGDFLVVDYIHPERGPQRVGLNFCNALKAVSEL